MAVTAKCSTVCDDIIDLVDIRSEIVDGDTIGVDNYWSQNELIGDECLRKISEHDGKSGKFSLDDKIVSASLGDKMGRASPDDKIGRYSTYDNMGRSSIFSKFSDNMYPGSDTAGANNIRGVTDQDSQYVYEQTIPCVTKQSTPLLDKQNIRDVNGQADRDMKRHMTLYEDEQTSRRFIDDQTIEHHDLHIAAFLGTSSTMIRKQQNVYRPPHSISDKESGQSSDGDQRIIENPKQTASQKSILFNLLHPNSIHPYENKTLRTGSDFSRRYSSFKQQDVQYIDERSFLDSISNPTFHTSESTSFVFSKGSTDLIDLVTEGINISIRNTDTGRSLGDTSHRNEGHRNVVPTSNVDCERKEKSRFRTSTEREMARARHGSRKDPSNSSLRDTEELTINSRNREVNHWSTLTLRNIERPRSSLPMMPVLRTPLPPLRHRSRARTNKNRPKFPKKATSNTATKSTNSSPIHDSGADAELEQNTNVYRQVEKDGSGNIRKTSHTSSSLGRHSPSVNNDHFSTGLIRSKLKAISFDSSAFLTSSRLMGLGEDFRVRLPDN